MSSLTNKAQFCRTLWLAAALCLSPALWAQEVASCLDQATTQAELNQCSVSDLKNADQRLNQLYQQILAQYADDPQFIAKFKAAQRAWLRFRDAELEALFPPHPEIPGYYGSVQPMCENNWRATLTLQRIEQLRKWLDGAEEGDVCSGSIRVKPGSFLNDKAT